MKPDMWSACLWSSILIFLIPMATSQQPAVSTTPSTKLFYNEKGTCDGQVSHKYTCCNHHDITKEHAGFSKEQEWCDNQKKPEDRCSFLLDTEAGVTTQKDQDELDEEELLYFLVIFGIIGYGAMVRGILRVTGLPIPYTVILMLSGFGIGFISKEYCQTFQKYTAVARTPPVVILFTFLPVLIFESAFSIPVHTFIRSAGQICIAAFPGMIFSTFATAAVCIVFLREYNWNFLESLLFGSIISATDPVAVVAILRELGASEMLSVMIEGESLLNDGVAILMYRVFEEMLVCKLHNHTVLEIIGQIAKKFCIIALGGPVFGYFMARIAIFCMSKIFNDATVEITITLVAAYLTYFIGDHILQVSGVMAVVALGLVMGSERTCISPEVQESVHQFWEMLGYLANTVLFVLVGIIISETALESLDWNDIYYLLFLYIALNIIRLVMLLILMPLLVRIGYGLKWENMIIMMWGGLRGAVGLCLAIEVFRGSLCEAHPLIGPKFLFQTAGIVMLTLVVNGTTTKLLLDTLKLTEISTGRIQDMANATKQLVASQRRTLAMLKHDRFLADANWKIVEKYCALEDPYIEKHEEHAKTDAVPSLLSLRTDQLDHETECDACHNLVRNEPTVKEFRDITEEGRLRMLKALKVSYWRQFEQGILTELAVLILVSVAEKIEDTELLMVHTSDLKKHWVVHGVVRLLRKFLLRKQTSINSVPKTQPSRPATKCLVRFWKIATNPCFNFCIMGLIVINLIPIIWELVRIIEELDKTADEWETAFNSINLAFTIVYTMEILIKALGLRRHYFRSAWNYVDMFVVVVSWVDIGVKYSRIAEHNKTMSYVFRIFKMVRIIRVIRLPRHVYPKIKVYVENKTNEQLFLGYDIGKGFLTAIYDVLKFLPQMVDHPRVLLKFKRALENQKLECVRQMGLLQKEHPGIAIAVKTRIASRAILNMMRESLFELKEDGLVDEKENELLNGMIEHNMKRLWSSPSSIPPSSPHGLFSNVTWILGNDEILAYMHEHAELKSFSFGDRICSTGDPPDGIFLIVSGMVKIHYHPTSQIISDVVSSGKLPNTELFLDLTFSTEVDDFFSTGTCIGEIGALTKAPRAATVTCETFVMAYHISLEVMEHAFELFNTRNVTLESRIWRAVGINIGEHILPTSPFYQNWSLDKIRLHLERSAVPVYQSVVDLEIPEFVSDVILLQGKVRNFHKKEVYVAPSLIPRSCIRFVKEENSTIAPRYLVVAYEDVDYENLSAAHATLHEYIIKTSALRKTPTDDEEHEKSSGGPGVLAGRNASEALLGRGTPKQRNRSSSVSPYPTVDGEIELPKITVSPRHHHTGYRTPHKH